MDFVEIEPELLQFNPFDLVGTDWMLITAGNESALNTMTASWGTMGVLWSQNVAVCFIRPTRYTKEFVDQTDDFTLSFFGDEWKDALEICGTVSGRDVDKPVKCGLTPCAMGESVAFEEASMVLVCHKIYAQELDPACFIEQGLIDQNYPERDFHTMYVGRIDHMYLSSDMFEEDDECDCGCDHEHGEGCTCEHHHE